MNTIKTEDKIKESLSGGIDDLLVDLLQHDEGFCTSAGIRHFRTDFKFLIRYFFPLKNELLLTLPNFLNSFDLFKTIYCCK